MAPNAKPCRGSSAGDVPPRSGAAPSLVRCRFADSEIALAERGYQRRLAGNATIVSGKPQLATRQAGGAIVSAIIEKTALLNFDTVQLDITRALNSVGDDPETRLPPTVP